MAWTPPASVGRMSRQALPCPTALLQRCSLAREALVFHLTQKGHRPAPGERYPGQR